MRPVGGFKSMRVDAWVEETDRGPGGGAGRRAAGLAAFGILILASGYAFALDGSTPNPPAKISPKNFTSAEQALRAGIDDLRAGDVAASVAALTYAAEGGQPIARWKLGEMYADGVGVSRDDVKAYQCFNRLVEDYDEDAPDQRNRGAVANAFVAVGVYSLTGIPNSEIHADPERARELFQYAATTFGDPDAEYNLAHMYIVGAGGLAKDSIAAVRWLRLAADEGTSAFAGVARPHAVHRRRRADAAGAGTDVARDRQERRRRSEGRMDPRALSARLRCRERQ